MLKGRTHLHSTNYIHTHLSFHLSRVAYSPPRYSGSKLAFFFTLHSLRPTTSTSLDLIDLTPSHAIALTTATTITATSAHIATNQLLQTGLNPCSRKRRQQQESPPSILQREHQPHFKPQTHSHPPKTKQEQTIAQNVRLRRKALRLLHRPRQPKPKPTAIPTSTSARLDLPVGRPREPLHLHQRADRRA